MGIHFAKFGSDTVFLTEDGVLSLFNGKEVQLTAKEYLDAIPVVFRCDANELLLLLVKHGIVSIN